jgi:DNA end-binding protein Ku
MAQAVWNGSLTFGLVNIPVKLYNATQPRDVRFHQFEAETGRRIRYRRVAAGPAPSSLLEGPSWEEETGAGHDVGAPQPDPAPDGQPREPTGTTTPAAPTRAGGEALNVPAVEADGPPPPVREPEPSEVAYEDVVKGFELEPERFVMLDPRELEALAPERTRAIEIEDFVDLAEIDPVHFEKSYYVLPGPGGADRPYWLLHRAMFDEGRVGIARFVMRTKEYLAAVRPGPEALVLETLFYADEVRNPRDLGLPPAARPAERELDVARRLVRSLDTAWDPERYKDTYRERVLELVRSKAGQAYTTVRHAEEEEPGGPRVQDLMAALQASLEAVKERERTGADDGSRERPKPAAKQRTPRKRRTG